MHLLGKLVFGILVSATGILTSAIPNGGQEYNYGTCPDGSKRSLASAASQAGPLPYCSSYVSTSISTVTQTSTTFVKGGKEKGLHELNPQNLHTQN